MKQILGGRCTDFDLNKMCSINTDLVCIVGDRLPLLQRSIAAATPSRR